MQVFRFNDASQTFGGRASPDHLGAITRNVPAVLLMCVRCCVVPLFLFQNFTVKLCTLAPEMTV